MLGQQIIQDVVGLQPRRPLMSVPAPAVQQVQYRVFRLRARIVPWRGINDVVVLLCRQSLDDLRGVVVQVQLPVEFSRPDGTGTLGKRSFAKRGI